MKTTGYNSAKSWGVAVACSLMNCMALLPLKITPMFFVAFVDRYHTDRRSASLFIVICVVLRCVGGPLVGYVGQIIDMKYICIVGCLFASFGTGICFLAEDIVFVTIFLGVVCGFGVTLAHTLIPQIIKQHFTKNISNANGVSLVGSCIGIFAIVPLISFFLNTYGTSGGLLLISGIMLHGVPLAMLLGNPHYKNEPTSLQAALLHENAASPAKQNASIVDPISFEKVLPKIHASEFVAVNTNVDEVKSISGTECSKVYYITQDTIQYKKQFMECNQHPKSNVSLQIPRDEIEQKIDSVKILAPNPIVGHSEMNEKESKYRKALKTFLIFRNPTYIVIMLFQSLHMYVLVFVFTILIEISRDKGINQSQEHYFLMSYLIAETVGYTCLGWVTDRGYLSVTNFMAVVIFCLGLSCCTLVFSSGFFSMMFASMGFGLCASAISSANPALVYEFVEDDRQTMAIASKLVLYAPLSFTMAPMIGYFRETLGSYDGALFLSTAICVGCSVLLILLPSIARFTNTKK